MKANAPGQFSHLYTHSRWRTLRGRQLAKEPLCRMCFAAENVVLATICDHVEPHRGDLAKFWSGPFQSLCKPHHDSTKQAAERSGRVRVIRQRIGPDGWPVGGR